MKFFPLSGIQCPDGYTRQLWRTMKLTFILLTAFFLHVSASTLAQQITLKKDRITIKQAFTEMSATVPNKEQQKPDDNNPTHLEQKLSDGLLSFDQLLHEVADEIKSAKKQGENDKRKEKP